MQLLVKLLPVLCVIALQYRLVLGADFLPQARMNFGNSVDTLRRFPHHVLIQNFTAYANNNLYYCGGSILNQHWILTAASCVQNVDALLISFERLQLRSRAGSYSVVVNSDAVYVYPTYYDDIALVRLPLSLDFNTQLRPIEVSRQSSLTAGQFVVLPAFENVTADYGYGTTTAGYTYTPEIAVRGGAWGGEGKLIYGMFSILDAKACLSQLKDSFDEYLQICTQSWANSGNKPSPQDVGNGLVLGWPGSPRLVGILTSTQPWSELSVYTNVAKYADWINGVITN